MRKRVGIVDELNCQLEAMVEGKNQEIIYLMRTSRGNAHSP